MPYVPPPEAAGGWRFLATDEEVRELAHMDPAVLNLIEREQENLAAGSSYGVVIVRNGYLVRECYSFNVAETTRFDIWSCTKSMTSTAWGIALDESSRRASGPAITLETHAYELIPEGHPLSDSRKSVITLRQLLSMTSGIGGELLGVMGCVTTTGHGVYEHALGRCPNRYGISLGELASDPGAKWDYSDPAFAHLSLAFFHAVGREMSTYFDERVLGRVGISGASWGEQGGAGHIGPHTNAHTGFVISARDLARIGYLFLNHGYWGGDEIVPDWWIREATRTSQPLNPSYGLGWVVNTAGTAWPYLPGDAFAANGYRANRCYAIPSLGLVVVRTGTGPALWDEAFLMERVMQAVLDA